MLLCYTNTDHYLQWREELYVPLVKGMKVNRGYATVNDDDGVNYRNISDILTEMGYKMNHSSARNYVIRVMRKFALAYAEHFDKEIDDARLEEIVRLPEFQSTIAEVLHSIEAERATCKETNR